MGATGWALFFLGVIAAATLATAAIQVGLIVYASRVARQLTATATRIALLAAELDREVRPILSSANAVGRDAARVAALAVTQMERADRVCADLADGVDSTLKAVQRTAAILSPAREWMAVLRGLQTGFMSLRRARRRRAELRHHEDEEALFI